MSGHSKWSKIKHKKGAVDAQRGKIFAKLGKEIFVAAKNGDPDPTNNAILRLAIDKAKAQSMPRDNIERAIERAKGPGSGVNYEEIKYEGYGPSGVAIMCYCLTDNRNRTASFVKSTFSRRGGNLGSDGSVSFLFEKKGVIVISIKSELELDELEMQLLELDILDYSINEDVVEIKCEIEKFEMVRFEVENSEFFEEFLTAEITMVPNMYVDLDENESAKVEALIDILEENDDIQDVFHNLKI